MGKSNNSFMKQASFLMIAGLISKVIGLLYRTPFRGYVGQLGYGYYGYANNVYVILLLISGYSIPTAVSKLVSEKIAMKQYRNAQRIFKAALLYGVIAGGFMGVICYAFAEQLLPKGAEGAVMALRVLAPVIPLSTILGVLRGYFQAHNNMMPTSISQVLEQIVHAVIAVVAAVAAIQMFSTDADSKAVYGAAGGTLGTGAATVAAILFMLLVYYASRRTIQRQIEKDKHKSVQSYRKIFKNLILLMTPIIFSSFVYQASAYVDQTIFAPLMLAKGEEADAITKIYGVFSGQYMQLINVPIALASASSVAMVPAVAASAAMGNMKEARSKIHEGIRFTMFISIPAAVGMGVLAFPIMSLLFPNSPDEAGIMLMVGSVSILFYGVSTISNGVLQSIGKPAIPLKNAAISLGVNVLVLCALTWFTGLGIYSVLIATMAYSLSVCILNAMALKKYLGFKNEFLNTYGKPVLAAAGMGVLSWIVYYGLYIFLRSNIICLAVSITVSVFAYLILYVMITKIDSAELRRFPMGSYMVKLLRIIKIY